MKNIITTFLILLTIGLSAQTSDSTATHVILDGRIFNVLGNWTAAQIPIVDAGALITATDVEGALQENRTAIDLNTAKVTNATHTGDVTGATALTIGADKILESMLKAVNTPTDEYVLTYEATTGDFEWEVDAGGTPEDTTYGVGWNADTDAASKNSIYDEMETRIDSDTTGTNGASARTIDNIISINQSDYDALTPKDADTFYVVTDAVDEHKFIVPLGGSTTNLAVADDVTHIPVLDAITITRIEADVLTAPTGAGITLDIELDDGTPASIFSTLLTIDATERFTSTAATPAVVSDSTIPADSFLTFNVDVIGSTIAGAGGTVTIYYTID